MNLTLRQLRAFAEIARLGSFTEAAGRLSLTQSATSGLLRELERQLGLPLVAGSSWFTLREYLPTSSRRLPRPKGC
jgi:DNA-binding transcriptional LysR family regulator